MKVGELIRLEEDGCGWRGRAEATANTGPEQAGYGYSSGKAELGRAAGTLNAILKQAGLKRAGSGE